MNVSLTSAERLEYTLRGYSVDRVPIWMLFNAFPQENPWYVDYFTEPSYAPVLEKILKATDVFQRHWFGQAFFYSGTRLVAKRTKIWREAGTRLFQTVYETPLGSMTCFLRRTAHGLEQKNLIESLQDLERILAVPYEPYHPDLSEFTLLRTKLGSQGLMMINLCDPLALLYFHCSTEKLLMWIATDLDQITSFLDVLYKRTYDHLTYLLENDVGPVYFIVGSEFAAPPMISPALFRRLVVNYDKQLIQLIHEHGAVAIIHHHGPARVILDYFLEINADGIHPLEAPPTGDVSLTEAKEHMGKRMCLIGNIQFDDLARKEPSQIDRAVQELISCWAPGGRFILSPTAGPYLEKLDTRIVANYLQFIETGLEYGHYNGL